MAGKFQKMDPKETPKVIAIGVIAVGMFGYFGMTMMSPPKKAPATADAEPKKIDAAAGQQANGEASEEQQKMLAQLLGSGSVYNPDPFRPVRLRGSKTPERVVPQPGPSKPTGGRRSGRTDLNPPVVPPATGNPQYPTAAPQVPVVEPPALPRPEINLTGLIDAQDGPDLAVATVGAESMILKVGDRLPNDYKVIRVVPAGPRATPCVWFENNPKVGMKDRFFVTLGGKTPVRETALAARPY